MKKNFTIACLLIFIYPILSTAQVYEKVIAPFTSVANGESEWVDLDNDHDLDLIFSGTTQTYVLSTLVYENVNGNFTLRSTNLPNIHYGSIAAGDYDKDGDADILISGSTNIVSEDKISAVFRNDGSFVFTQQHQLQGLSNSSTEWFDLDNDEDLDIIMNGRAGSTSDSFVTLLFENTGSGFTEINGSNLPNSLGGTFNLADGNGDGRIDVMFTGSVTALYLNNGDKTFSEHPQAMFQQLYNGSGEWGDFDVDGDMDLALTGYDLENQHHTLIYENTNGRSFTERTDILLLGMGVNENGVQWFDYNNDGMLDLLVTGRSIGSGGRTNRIFTNTGVTFAEHIEPAFDPLDNYSVDVGDFDNDGDMDISFEGYRFSLSGSRPFSGYYKNTINSGTPAPNTAPHPPVVSTFIERPFRKEVRFRWESALDAETLYPTYNFYLRNAAKKIVVPNVDFSNGYIRSKNVSNGFGTRGFVNDVPEGVLYYAIQSVDGALEGSPFSAEKMFFHFNGPECTQAEIVDDDNVKLSWLDHSALETNFRVERSTDSEIGFVQLTTRPANSSTYTDNFNFLTETYYYYRVTGYNATQTSPYDSLILMVPERTTDLDILPINASTIQLSWKDHSQHETGFWIERKKSTESSFQKVAILPANTEYFEDVGLDQGTSYEYRVRSVSKNGGLTPLEIVSAQTNFLPVGADFQKEMAEDSMLPFTKADFEIHFTDQDPSDFLVRIKINELPQNGTLLWVGLPVVAGAELEIDQLDGLSFMPEQDFVGSATFSVLAFDGKDYSSNAWTITAQVNQVNDAPTFDFQADRVVNEDFGGNYFFYATRLFVPFEFDEVVTYSVSPETSDIATIIFNKETGELIIGSKKDQFGEIEFTLTANDGQAENNTYSRKFKLTISPVNDPPEISYLQDIEAEVGAIIPPILITVTDVDNVISLSMFSVFSTYPKVLKNENIILTLISSGKFSMQLTPEHVVGRAAISISVNDGTDIAFLTFYLTLQPITGIEDISESELIIFPNPFTNKMTISTGPSFSGCNYMTVYDALGQALSMMELNGRETTIPTETLLPGIYFVKITKADGTHFKRRIVKI